MVADFEGQLGTDLRQIAPLGESFGAWGAGALLTEREIFQVNVVLEELVTNVIVHGLGEGRPGWVRLRIARRGDGLMLELRDNAPPFDPFQMPPPNLTRDIDARQVGGLGIHFVRTFMDWWNYSRVGEENVVTLGKDLGGLS